jgi:hypothetical protein
MNPRNGCGRSIPARATIIKESLRKPVVAGSGVIASMMDRG